MNWRPNKGWEHFRNDYFEQNQLKAPYYKIRQADYEAGADAVLEALYKLAQQSPTRTFTIDSRVVTIYEVK